MDSFFGIGIPELIAILVISGIVMGPERITHFARWMGKSTAQMRAISGQFMQQINNEIDGVDDDRTLRDAMSEMQQLRDELLSIRTELTGTAEEAVGGANDVIQTVKKAERVVRAPSMTGLAATVLTAGTKPAAAEDGDLETTVASLELTETAAQNGAIPDMSPDPPEIVAEDSVVVAGEVAADLADEPEATEPIVRSPSMTGLAAAVLRAGSEPQPETVMPANGSTASPAAAATKLPNLIEVPDDPSL